MWQTSEKKACDTLSFCRTLTDYSGEPLRLQEQKDVNEFCTMLFDKLESLDPRCGSLVSCFSSHHELILSSIAAEKESLEPVLDIHCELHRCIQLIFET